MANGEEDNSSNKRVTNSYCNESTSKHRWEVLHDLNKLQKNKLEEERKRIQMEKDNENNQYCTFTPKLISAYKLKQKNNQLVTEDNNSDQEKETLKDNSENNKDKDYYNALTESNLLDRQQTWMKMRQMKIEQMKEKMKNENQNQKFFAPTVVCSAFITLTINRILLMQLKK